MRCGDFFNRKRGMAYVCSLLSAYTLFAFHYPFFSYVAENVTPNFGGRWLVCSLFLVMLALNYLVYYLLLYLCRVVGKYIIVLSIVCNALCLYFVNTYNVLIDRSMMGNLFNTQYSEASSFFAWGMFWYALLLGIIPSLLLCRKKINYGTAKAFFKNILISLVIIIAMAWALPRV